MSPLQPLPLPFQRKAGNRAASIVVRIQDRILPYRPMDDRSGGRFYCLSILSRPPPSRASARLSSKAKIRPTNPKLANISRLAV